MTYEQWRENQRSNLDITEEQLDCLLEIAQAVTIIGGSGRYDDLAAGILRMSAMSASEIAAIVLEIGGDD